MRYLYTDCEAITWRANQIDETSSVSDDLIDDRETHSEAPISYISRFCLIDLIKFFFQIREIISCDTLTIILKYEDIRIFFGKEIDS